MSVFYDIDLPDLGGGGGDKPTPADPIATNPLVKPLIPGGNPPLTPIIPTKIPLPNYADPASRLKYAQNYYNQYPQVGHGYGDTPLRVNEKPEYGEDTPKNMVTPIARKLGLNPALVYAGAMDEGMSGFWKDKDGNISTSEIMSGDYPVSGYANFGLDTFADKYPTLVKKGYLTPDFAQQFQKSPHTNELNEKVNSADFKTVGGALQAHAAMLKYHYDDVDSYAKARGIKLSPQARDFFTQAEYNGGEGTGHSMLNDYYNNGLLEGDKFMKDRPTSGRGLKENSYKGVYDTARRRVVMARGLTEQKLLDDK
jgi:hypothetical protein